jgi:hypothetical protein
MKNPFMNVPFANEKNDGVKTVAPMPKLDPAKIAAAKAGHEAVKTLIRWL